MSKKINKSNWVYTAKEINVKRGLCYGMMDLMGGGWNNIVSGVIFAYLTLAQGFNPALSGIISAADRIVNYGQIKQRISKFILFLKV